MSEYEKEMLGKMDQLLGLLAQLSVSVGTTSQATVWAANRALGEGQVGPNTWLSRPTFGKSLHDL